MKKTRKTRLVRWLKTPIVCIILGLILGDLVAILVILAARGGA